MTKLNCILFCVIVSIALSCKQDGKKDPVQTKDKKQEIMTYKTIGEVNRLDPAIDKLIPIEAKIEILASGFDWSEGPVWVDELDGLLFCDIPPNKIHLWKQGMSEAPVYLTPSGYTGEKQRGGEVGSNGLIVNKNGQLVLCQHGDRRIAFLDAKWDDAKPSYKTIADKYEGNRFNSPNDVIQRSNGDYYFTDPPYGLELQMEDPTKEIDYQGVYRCKANGEVSLLTKTMTRPNGLAFSPDESILYVYVMDPNGKLLGMINTTEATSNCAFGGKDKDYLYMTCDMHLMRIKLSTTSAI